MLGSTGHNYQDHLVRMGALNTLPDLSFVRKVIFYSVVPCNLVPIKWSVNHDGKWSMSKED